MSSDPPYRYRAGQLLVHVDDAGEIVPEIAGLGFAPVDRYGPMLRFAGPVQPAVPVLVERFRGRVAPNHVLAAAAGGGSRQPTGFPGVPEVEIVLPDGTRLPTATGGGFRQPRGGAPIGGIDFPEAVPGDPAPWNDLEPLPAKPVTIGLIDTGIVVADRRAHPWFGDGAASHVEFDLDGDADPLDTDVDGLLDQSDGHGTFVAGRILHEAPAAKVRMMRVLDDGLGDDAAVAAAIGLLGMDEDISLINLSFGGTAREDSPPRVIEYALRQLRADVVVVCAAGNFGDTRPHWPGAFDRVTAVGAVDEGIPWVAGQTAPPIATFSSRGRWVDAYAAGVRVLGPHCWFSEFGPSVQTRGRPPQDFTGWARWSGTSFAAATVTGRIAALMATPGVSAVQARAEVLEEDPARMIADGLGNRARWVTGVDWTGSSWR